MTRDHRAALRAVVAELAEEFGEDLEAARVLLRDIGDDAKVQAVARSLDEAIVAEQARRGRVTRLAAALREKRVELNGSTPPDIAKPHLERVARLEASVSRWEVGGVSEESAENVAFGIEEDLKALRESVRRGRGERDPGVRGWLRRKLSEFTTRYFCAARGRP